LLLGLICHALAQDHGRNFAAHFSGYLLRGSGSLKRYLAELAVPVLGYNPNICHFL
jgi:hypothetical protein